MLCVCGGDSTVWDSRVRGTAVMRRRRCLACGARWNTVEVADLELKRRTDTGATVGAPRTEPEAHPVVRFMFRRLAEIGWTDEGLERLSRVSGRTFRKWRTSRIPRLDTMDQALRPLGYEVWVRRLGDVGGE